MGYTHSFFLIFYCKLFNNHYNILWHFVIVLFLIYSMILAVILLVLWLFFLWYSANHLINTSVRIAQYFKVSALLIWLTVLAMGTSAPELFLSWMAALNGSWSLSVGNVIWSNIFNLWFILWLSALVAPIAIQKKLVYRDWIFLIFITCLIFVMLWDQHVARWEWGILLLLLVWYNTYLWLKKESNWEEVEDVEKPKMKNFFILFWISILLSFISWEAIEWVFWLQFWISLYWIVFLSVLLIMFLVSLFLRRDKHSSENKLWMLLNLTKLIASLGVLVLSSDLVVNAAVFIAQYFWVSEWAIWATIVAAWTSLPELAATIAAIAKKKYDMGVGNVVGSDIFNILGIIGISAIITPLNLNPNCLLSAWCENGLFGLLFRDNIFSVGVLIITLIITFVFMRTWWKLSKWEGAFLFILALLRMAFEINPSYFMRLIGL